MKLSMVVMTLLPAMVLLLSGCWGASDTEEQSNGLSEAEKHYNAGVELQEQGRYEEAIAEYDEVIRLNPQLALAYGNRGGAYSDLGQLQRAIQDYDEAISLNPHYAKAYVNRALAYTHLGDDTKAQQDVGRAVELGWDSVTLKADIEKLKETR